MAVDRVDWQDLASDSRTEAAPAFHRGWSKGINRLNPDIRFFDLPAPQSLKVQAGGRQSGDEIDNAGCQHSQSGLTSLPPLTVRAGRLAAVQANHPLGGPELHRFTAGLSHVNVIAPSGMGHVWATRILRAPA